MSKPHVVVKVPRSVCTITDEDVTLQILPRDLTPEVIAEWVRQTNLITFGELQTLLAKDGLSLSVQTGTIEIYEPLPGEESVG